MLLPHHEVHEAGPALRQASEQWLPLSTYRRRIKGDLPFTVISRNPTAGITTHSDEATIVGRRMVNRHSHHELKSHAARRLQDVAQVE